MSAAIFPGACLLWAGTTMVAGGIANELVFDRDSGLGDSFSVKLPNGYKLSAIDTLEYGSLHPPGARESIADLVFVQGEGHWILGETNNKRDPFRPPSQAAVTEYFLLDTRNGQKSSFAQKSDLDQAARRLGINLHLLSVEEAYANYRRHWFDLVLLLLAIGPIAIAAVYLFRFWSKLRRENLAPPSIPGGVSG